MQLPHYLRSLLIISYSKQTDVKSVYNIERSLEVGLSHIEDTLTAFLCMYLVLLVVELQVMWCSLPSVALELLQHQIAPYEACPI